MLDKSKIQLWSLEELLEEFRKNVLSFQFVPHPDYQENIKAIKQEIYLRFHDLQTKLDLIELSVQAIGLQFQRSKKDLKSL